MAKKPAHLYLNMILKDDEPVEMVQRSIESVRKYVDDVYITVTYSDKEPDSSNKLVKYLKGEKFHVDYFKWVKDFAAARNFAMDQVPHGRNEYIYWQDADDILRGGENIRELLEQSQKDNTSAWFFHYYYQVELDDRGEVKEILVDHKRERIVRNDHTYKWIGRLHEILIQQRDENVIKKGVTPNVAVVIHMSNQSRKDNSNIDRNLEILEAQYKDENGKDPRTTLYLARAYLDKGKLAQIAEDEELKEKYFRAALKLFHDYLEGSGDPVYKENYKEPSGWREERGTAWAHVGEIAILMDNLDAAAQAYQSAIEEAYEFPQHYVDLAMVYSLKGDLKKAKHWLKLATDVEQPNTTVITSPRDLKFRSLDVDFQICIHEGKFEQAIEDLEMMKEIMPDNPTIDTRLETTKRLNETNKVSQSLVFIGKYIEKTEPKETKKEKLESLVRAIPQEVEEEQFASEMQHLFLPPRKWEDNEIAILCGQGFEEWSPKSLKTGIGGSEKAVIYMAKELTKLGWKVTVYASPGQEAGIHDGVEYRTWHKLNMKDEFNVLILWRAIGFVDFQPKAKFTMVWMHDIPNNPDFTEDRVNAVNKIAVLSEFHKGLLRIDRGGNFEPMPEKKVFLTANGIPPVTINKKWKRDPHKMIYSSSPDRGLLYLLNMWPKIIKEVPDATLDIYYGFNVFDALHRGAPGKEMWKRNLLNLMKQPGVNYHGRIGSRELNKQQAMSAIWAYPTDFEEISCITAMEAQAYGAIPVTTTVGAVNETVRNGIKVDVDISTEKGQEEYANALIKLLKDEKEQAEIRGNMMEWAANYFQWSEVAKQWDRELRVRIQNPELLYATRENIKKEVDK